MNVQYLLSELFYLAALWNWHLVQCMHSSINPNPLAILARNLPESVRIRQNPTACSPTTDQPTAGLSWNWDTRPHAKYPCLGYTVPSPSKSNRPCWWSLNGLGWLGLRTASKTVTLSDASEFLRSLEWLLLSRLSVSLVTMHTKKKRRGGRYLPEDVNKVENSKHRA